MVWGLTNSLLATPDIGESLSESSLVFYIPSTSCVHNNQ